MLASHWSFLVGFIALLDWRRPTTSELAVSEVALLRTEVSRLRILVEQLELSGGGCQWETWWQGWLIRVLLFLWLGTLALLVSKLIKISPVKPRLVLKEDTSQVSAGSEQSPTLRSVAVTSSSSRSSGPVRPSDLRRTRHGAVDDA